MFDCSHNHRRQTGKPNTLDHVYSPISISLAKTNFLKTLANRDVCQSQAFEYLVIMFSHLPVCHQLYAVLHGVLHLHIVDHGKWQNQTPLIFLSVYPWWQLRHWVLHICWSTSTAHLDKVKSHFFSIHSMPHFNIF